MNNTEPISILVVESQPLMLAMLGAALSSDDMVVLGEVADSSRAIQSVAQYKPRVIVFSVGVPSLPDVERIAAIRNEFPDVLILALVNGDFRGEDRMALDYGAHQVLTKAASRAELIAGIRELLRENISTRATLHKKKRGDPRELAQPG